MHDVCSGAVHLQQVLAAEVPVRQVGRARLLQRADEQLLLRHVPHHLCRRDHGPQQEGHIQLDSSHRRLRLLDTLPLVLPRDEVHLTVDHDFGENDHSSYAILHYGHSLHLADDTSVPDIVPGRHSHLRQYNLHGPIPL